MHQSYTRIDKQLSYRKPCLEEMVNKHIEESSRKNEKFQEWMNKMKEDTKRNLRNQNSTIKNLESQIGQLAKNVQARKSAASLEECKVLSTQEEKYETKSNISNKFCVVSYLQENEGSSTFERMPCQLPKKEPNPGKFMLHELLVILICLL